MRVNLPGLSPSWPATSAVSVADAASESVAGSSFADAAALSRAAAGGFIQTAAQGASGNVNPDTFTVGRGIRNDNTRGGGMRTPDVASSDRTAISRDVVDSAG